jgi:hypothetical protein
MSLGTQIHGGQSYGLGDSRGQKNAVCGVSGGWFDGYVEFQEFGDLIVSLVNYQKAFLDSYLV